MVSDLHRAQKNNADVGADMNWGRFLTDTQRRAVQSILDDLRERDDLAGVVLAGSIIRGEGGPTSDLDVYVVVTSPYRQRRQVLIDNVRAEIFINPPWTIRAYFTEERHDGGPATAHMLVTGHVLYRQGSLLDELRSEAAAMLAAGPAALSESALTERRYFLIDLVEDAEDMRRDDPDALAFLLPGIVERSVTLLYARARRWRPKPKRLPSDLNAVDTHAAVLLRAYLHEADLATRHAAALALASHALGDIPRQFFAWDTELEYMPVPDQPATGKEDRTPGPSFSQ